jgi:PhnB protein
MTFVPVLQFDGTCAEALTFYARVFGGTLDLTRYFEVPETARLPPSDRVIYGEVRVGEAMLTGMDYPSGMPVPEGRGGAVSWVVPDVETGQHITDMLTAEGGFVLWPYGPCPWARGFGLLRDRFGTVWLIATEGTPANPAPA